MVQGLCRKSHDFHVLSSRPDSMEIPASLKLNYERVPTEKQVPLCNHQGQQKQLLIIAVVIPIHSGNDAESALLQNVLRQFLIFDQTFQLFLNKRLVNDDRVSTAIRRFK